MSIDCIDHIVVPVKSLSEASAAYERLGLKLTPVTRHQGLGTENRVFFVGSGANDFYLELLAIHDRAVAINSARVKLYLQSVHEGGGIARLMLGTQDIEGAVEKLKTNGVNAEIESVFRESGVKICDVATLEGVPGLGINAGLIQYVEKREVSHERRHAAGHFAHAFPLKRLDHLAIAAPDLDAMTCAWSDWLGASVSGEVRAPGIIIRQIKLGDAIIELLGSLNPESGQAARPTGLVSLCAWEVTNLEGAVALANERGFSPSEPREGVLPGTRVSTIPGTELAGVRMQMLEYVQL